jgi:hypothetical protein
MLEYNQKVAAFLLRGVELEIFPHGYGIKWKIADAGVNALTLSVLLFC